MPPAVTSPVRRSGGRPRRRRPGSPRLGRPREGRSLRGNGGWTPITPHVAARPEWLHRGWLMALVGREPAAAMLNIAAWARGRCAPLESPLASRARRFCARLSLWYSTRCRLRCTSSACRCSGTRRHGVPLHGLREFLGTWNRLRHVRRLNVLGLITSRNRPARDRRSLTGISRHNTECSPYWRALAGEPSRVIGFRHLCAQPSPGSRVRARRLGCR